MKKNKNRTPIPVPPQRDHLRPKLGNTPVNEDKYWTFSFANYQQIENFGFNGANVSSRWFVSLLERLKDLSSRKLSDFLKDSTTQSSQGYRFHPINWSQKNIPVQRHELHWLSPMYLENEAEYPLYQFQISKANGRVIGFFDEKNHFNIVLFDPLHNMQPSKSHAYRVDPCSPMACDYTHLSDQFEQLKTVVCTNANCGYQHHLHKLSDATQPANAVIHFLDEDMAQNAQDHIDSGSAANFTDIFENGIIYLQEQASLRTTEENAVSNATRAL